ncbi:MAG: peptide chain release factor N(5)-glutamine methyltransferase, partial [Phycisphaerales bacterium]|nr:peptide chain release factor N(5)-glutamine methyltransferase [Phycisphaerales bacterium]
SLEFEVRPGLFIPRPETETLVMEALQLLQPRSQARVLDLCTGTGCIAVTIAHHARTADVTAVDLNPLAVETASANGQRHNVSDRLSVLLGDLYAPLDPTATFDLIVSNPPYVRDDEMPGLQRDVRDHEPHLALAAGADGLDVVRRIVDGLSARLAAGGALLLEIDPQQADATIDIVRGSGLFQDVVAIKDLARVDRVVRAVR